MAKKKTSAEVAREQSEIAKVEGMLGDAFGGLGGLEQPTPEANVPEDSMPGERILWCIYHLPNRNGRTR